MVFWAVEPKTTQVVRSPPITTFLRRALSAPHQICTNRSSHQLLFKSSNAHRKHHYAFLHIKPFPSLQRIGPLLYRSGAGLSTVFQTFDKMSHREHRLQNMGLFEVLDLVKFSAMKPDVLTARIVHSLVLRVGALADIPTSTSLLITYSRAGDFGSSVALFDETLYKDVIIRNAMMTACIENKYFGAAVDFFVDLMEGGTGFDSATLVIAISALSNTNGLEHGQIVHGLSVKAGMLPDTFLCNALTDMYAKCGELSSSECVFEEMQVRDLVSWNSVISGCLYNSNPEKSLQYFKKMVACGEQADGITLSSAIAASTCLGQFGVGEVIHGWGIKLGFEESSHISVANSVISLCSHGGNTGAAESVFRGMVHKDVISWNSMVDCFATNRMTFEAFDLLREMQLVGLVQPNSVTLVSIIPLCAGLMLLREGRSVHGVTVRRDMLSDFSVANSLMDMYLKCCNVKAAEHLFSTMPVRDLVSWNTVISGYSQNGYSRAAQTLFKEKLGWCSHCSLSTLLAILSSCGSPESLHFGKSIHCWQLKLGFSNNMLAINSLVFMYVNCGDLKTSLSLLSRISAMADTACWNTVIAGCTQKGHFWKALETFNLMRRESHTSHDSITLVNVISACGNVELLCEGKLLHALSFKTFEGTDIRVHNALITMYGRLGEIECAKLVFSFSRNRNLCSWNCMISAFSQNRDGKRALELFSCLDYEPNEITISSVLSACTQLGLLRHGKQIHACVFRFGFQRNCFISAALVDMYSNCGRLDVAMQIFQNLPEKSVAAWNSMISAFGFHNNSEKAFEVLHEMIESGTCPTKSTFINLLSTCSHLGLVDEGQWYYDHMLDEFGVEPVTEHHVCMVDMLGRSGRLCEACEFIKKMPTQPEPGVWGALLSACNYYGDLEMGRQVADILFRLEPDNVGHYVSLFNMYVAAGRWSDAAEVRRIVDDKRLRKTPGYSLLDVGFG